MSDNPFAESSDSDGTVVRGPVRATAPSAAAAPAAPPRRAEAFAPMMAGEAERLPQIGIGPLTAAAAPMLDLLARLTANAPIGDIAELGTRARSAMRDFRDGALAGGVAPDAVEEAHYALCAAIDDVAAGTSWGQGGAWSAHSLASELHRDVKSGERFFQRVAKIQETPGHFREALEVAYLCLALGMQGRFRLERNGRAELDQIRERLYQTLIQLRGAWDRELSPHWRGLDAPHVPGRRMIPTWTAAALSLAVLGGVYAWVSGGLSSHTDFLFSRLAALPPGTLPAIQRLASPQPPAKQLPAPEPSLPAKLRQFLAAEIQEGLVSVVVDPNRTLVRIRNRGMFASGSASVDPRFVTLLSRIGQALRDEPGQVMVVGHSDDQPIRTARFPSNYHLSAARAQAAATIVATAEGGTAGRFSAEGRGEAEPIASNSTPEGRDANRRIEVVIDKGGRL